MLAIGSMPDHIHMLIGYNVNQLIPDIVEEVKTSSNRWIKEKKLSKFKVEWQKGYGAFTHSHSQIDRVIKYILSQEGHHKKRSFKDEYLEMLEKNEIIYGNEYLLNFSIIIMNRKNITVLCTSVLILLFRFYKYSAALPLS